jgi:hypothetical protein
MKKSNFALRLPPSLMDEARKLAKSEGVAVNQLINVAIAEKVAALRTEEYFAERADRADIDRARSILNRAGVGRSPLPGDELPESREQSHVKKTALINGSRSVDKQIRFAIAQKRVIQVSYNGRLRTAEPHDYGMKNGSPKLLIYQLTGETRGAKTSVHGWKLLEVSRIDACIVSDDTFPGSRRQRFQRHMTWDDLFARVA